MTTTLEGLLLASGKVIRDVLGERQRQLGPLGHTPEHDDKLQPNALVERAISKLHPHPVDRYRIVQACATLIAEIERIDRACLREGAEAAKRDDAIQSCPYRSGDPRANAWREGYLAEADPVQIADVTL